jgi:putative MATE family efflux protein
MRVLSRLGVIEESRLRATVDLAWPRVVTGFAIMSKRTVDLAVVGVALGPAAVAGLTLANAYWMLGKFVVIGLAGGTIALVSQNYGGGESARAARVVGTSLVLGVALSIPLAVAFAGLSNRFVSLLADDPATLRYAGLYLTVVAPGLVFEAVNLVASRTWAGAGDTVTPMSMRAGGAALNVVLSVAFVFGAGLGVVGAALGTTLSTFVVTLAFAWGLAGRAYWYPLGRLASASPIPVRREALAFEADLVRQLLSVSAPLVARRVAQGVVVFPLLAIAATFGPVAVAAVGVARQVRAVAHSPGWGFSIAASTLVGQALGGDDETDAEAYGSEITRFSAVVYVLTAATMLLLSVPIASLFVDAPADVALTAAFVAAAALSLVPLGVDASVTGTLRGAGDTRIPFLATLAGLYLVALPLAWVGTVTALGVVALQAALVAETVVPMLVNLSRFRTNAWKSVSRQYRPSAGD